MFLNIPHLYDGCRTITRFLPSACSRDRPGCERMLFGVVGKPDDSTATGLVLEHTTTSNNNTFIWYYLIMYNIPGVMIKECIPKHFGVFPANPAESRGLLWQGSSQSASLTLFSFQYSIQYFSQTEGMLIARTGACLTVPVQME